MGHPLRPSESTLHPRSVNGQSPPSEPRSTSPPPVGPPGSPHKRVKRLRVAQMAARLESPLRTVRYWCFIGYLPAYKLGRREWCIDEEDFVTWMAERREAEN